MNNNDDGFEATHFSLIRDAIGVAQVKPKELRDEFAMRIIAAMISNNWPIVGEYAANTSEIAYAAADAMLKERAK